MITQSYFSADDTETSRKIHPFVKRGEYYAGKTSDGRNVRVHWGSEFAYPIGETVGIFPIEHIPSLIAALTAATKLKE